MQVSAFDMSQIFPVLKTWADFQLIVGNRSLAGFKMPAKLNTARLVPTGQSASSYKGKEMHVVASQSLGIILWIVLMLLAVPYVRHARHPRLPAGPLAVEKAATADAFQLRSPLCAMF